MISHRLTSITVSNTAIEVLPANPNRVAVIFNCGNAAGTGSVVLKDHDATATTTNGVPVSQAGGPLRIEGQAAGRRWTAIRLVAADTQLGILEEFADGNSN